MTIVSRPAIRTPQSMLAEAVRSGSRFDLPAGCRAVSAPAAPAMDARPARGKDVVLPALRPNEGLQASFRRDLLRLVDEMNASLLYWLRAAYGANEPEVSDLAMDDSPARNLQKTMDKLSRRWIDRFEKMATPMAKKFAAKVMRTMDKQFRDRLQVQSIPTVPFKMTRGMNDVLQATVQEQTALITNLGSQQLARVQGVVMRSVTQGRDLATLSRELQDTFHIPRKRAALIARDQNNKATAVFVRVRQADLGITTALWMHSTSGEVPRPTHLANNGKPYNVSKGWYDPAAKQYIWPGVLVNCRCVSRPVIEGFIL